MHSFNFLCGGGWVVVVNGGKAVNGDQLCVCVCVNRSVKTMKLSTRSTLLSQLKQSSLESI